MENGFGDGNGPGLGKLGAAFLFVRLIGSFAPSDSLSGAAMDGSTGGACHLSLDDEAVYGEGLLFPPKHDLDDCRLARCFRIGQWQVMGELWELTMEWAILYEVVLLPCGRADPASNAAALTFII